VEGILNGFREWRILRACAAAAVLGWLAFAAAAQPVRYHGIQLDERYKLMVEERERELVVFLAGRDRVPGGPIKHEKLDGGIETTYRVTDQEILFRVRTEIMRASPPNYLSNPGLKYRITVEGVEMSPNMRVMHEVPAAEVRDVLAAEMVKLGIRAEGRHREAMHHAVPLVLGVLRASGRFPAEVPMTIERSEVGRIRGLGEGLERKPLPAGRNLNPLAPEDSVTSPERPFGFNLNPNESEESEESDMATGSTRAESNR
jgi:hypothetical protein